ncbi:MAG: ATP-binding protein [Eubacteriales bacterium]|nr:ATP-binding protein [Eubacteriales bacterium]
MDREVLKQALNECKAEQLKNRQLEIQKQQEAFDKIPEIIELVEKRHSLIFDSLKTAFATTPAENIHEQMQEINKLIKDALNKAGLPENQFEAVYTCAMCRDTGFVGEHKKEFCSCVYERYRLITASRFKDLNSAETFESYDESVFSDKNLPNSRVSQRAYMQLIKEICENYANSLPTPSPLNMLFYGKSGLGKTYLLNSIAMRAKQNNIACISLTANSLLNEIRSAYFGRDDSPLKSLYDVQLLLIDDLGTEPLWENITVEQLFALINHRFSNGKNTVISTNLSLTELQQRYTERITSRLLDPRVCKTIQFLGDDIRKRK